MNPGEDSTISQANSVVNTLPDPTATEVVQSNSSGLGKESVVPEEIKGWSWAGFLWTWVWAIGTRTWVGLIGVVFPLNIIISVILGLKGTEWAWRNKKWESVESFNKIQKEWVKWWLIIFGSLIVFAIVGIIFSVFLITVDPMKQTRISNCLQNCQMTSNPQVCKIGCK